jgi:hypothetical protein
MSWRRPRAENARPGSSAEKRVFRGFHREPSSSSFRSEWVATIQKLDRAEPGALSAALKLVGEARLPNPQLANEVRAWAV